MGGPTGPADPAGTEFDPADSTSWSGAVVFLRDGIYYLMDYGSSYQALAGAGGYLHIRSNTVLVGESWATIIRAQPNGLTVPAQTPAHQGGTTVRFTLSLIHI